MLVKGAPGNLRGFKAMQGTASYHWKTIWIPTAHTSPQGIAAYPERTKPVEISELIFRGANETD